MRRFTKDLFFIILWSGLQTGFREIGNQGKHISGESQHCQKRWLGRLSFSLVA